LYNVIEERQSEGGARPSEEHLFRDLVGAWTQFGLGTKASSIIKNFFPSAPCSMTLPCPKGLVNNMALTCSIVVTASRAFLNGSMNQAIASNLRALRARSATESYLR